MRWIAAERQRSERLHPEARQQGIEAAGQAFDSDVLLFGRMYPCSYGFDQTVCAIDINEIARPHFGGFPRLFGLRGANISFTKQYAQARRR